MAGLLYIVLDMKPLYSNATRIAFRGKMHFMSFPIGQVKQTFIAFTLSISLKV